MSGRSVDVAGSSRAKRLLGVRHVLRSSLARVISGVGLLCLSSTATVGSELGIHLSSANPQVTLTLTGGTGRWQRIEASANLLDWSALTCLFQTNPASGWIDSAVTNLPAAFNLGMLTRCRAFFW